MPKLLSTDPDCQSTAISNNKGIIDEGNNSAGKKLQWLTKTARKTLKNEKKRKVPKS